MPMSEQQIAYMNETVDVKKGAYTRFDLINMAMAAAPVAVKEGPQLFATLSCDGDDKPGGVIKLHAGAHPTDFEVPTKDTLPWEDGDAPPLGIDVLKAVQYLDEKAPRGKPSLVHVFEVLSWLRADDKRREIIVAAVHGGDAKKGKMVKAWSAVSDAIARLPVFDTARWLFTAMGDSPVTVKDFYDAFTGLEPSRFAIGLRAWGVKMDGIDDGSPAAHAVSVHSYMADIISGAREDGDWSRAKKNAPHTANAGEIMIGLKAAYDKMPDAVRQRMGEHIVKNYDADKEKALKPLSKVLEIGHVSTLSAMLTQGDIPVGVLAGVFQNGWWDRLYSALLGCCDTKGPIPDWFTKDS